MAASTSKSTPPIEASIFDLDGVIVDTAKYHYMAWKRLANELGFDFTPKDNERLKGVSRMRSLEILLEIAGLRLDEQSKAELAERKNRWYIEYISRLSPSEDPTRGARVHRWPEKAGCKDRCRIGEQERAHHPGESEASPGSLTQ